MSRSGTPEERELERLLTELDRLEDLRDEMEELGIPDRTSLEARMDEVNAAIDVLTGE
jgi:hypothetical protein